MEELVGELAKENKVSDDIVKMIIKKAVVNSVSKFYGTDKSYTFELETSIVTIIENNEIKKIKLSEIGIDKSQRARIILLMRSNMIKLLSEFNPIKNSKTSKNEDLESDDNAEFNYESNYDSSDNFKWGGLSGEEAYVAYWNCD
jgi:hypothetical protein